MVRIGSLDHVVMIHDYLFWIGLTAASVLLSCVLCYAVRALWEFFSYWRFINQLEETIDNGEKYFGAKQH